MELNVINPLIYANWNHIVSSHPQCSIFHKSEWARVLAETYRYHPRYLLFMEKGEPAAVVPLMEVYSRFTGRRGVALPFTDYGSTLFFNDCDHNEILSKVIMLGEQLKWGYFELRECCQPLKNKKILLNYVNHTLCLQKNIDGLFSGLQSSHRRNIRKAQRSKVEITRQYSLKAMHEFYRLNCLTRREHGLPPQPFRFFKNIQQQLIADKNGFIMLAYYQGFCVAGAIFFLFGKKAYYKYGASDKIYQSLRPNNLVMWEAIKWCSQNDFTTLCFGRTHPDNKGLLKFKSGWGATEQMIHYYRYNLKQKKFVQQESIQYGMHNVIFRRMPMPMLAFIGRILYRHVG